MLKTQYRVDVIESERGYGQRLEFSKYFETKELADQYISEFKTSGNSECYIYADGPRSITYETNPISKKKSKKKKVVTKKIKAKNKAVKKKPANKKLKLAQDCKPVFPDYGDDQYFGGYDYNSYENRLINGKDPNGPLS